MSGNYGWGGRDRPSRSDDSYSRSSYNSGFSRARTPYQDSGVDYSRADQIANRAGNPSSVNMSQAANRKSGKVDLSLRKAQKATKQNVIIVANDTTGSMGYWRAEIAKRLALMFNEAQGFLGESLEILFIGFGDVPEGDPIEATPFGSGPILSEYINSLTRQSMGYNNAIESPDLAAMYVHSLVDTSEAKNVYFFIITDEGFYPNVSPSNIDAIMGVRLPSELTKSADVFKRLKARMGVFTILAQTGCYSDSQRRVIKSQWEDALTAENVVPLDDARRVVDVMLGVIAKTTGQFTKFSTDLSKRQGGTQYGSENIQNVLQSISMVRGAPTSPKPPNSQSLADMNADIDAAGASDLNDDNSVPASASMADMDFDL
ncbi:hypothetical protein COT97_03280 [Candidatus Falkowbacteria bacterium CG10_big_fil_rev_8_21_14_0_10_39_11]|uniref:Uncharacterized protein n=1 Tax=Candidatus Falkowbacteria bacterium CG10_big_fil_rev_8_21_14_0_10_39_11 TaxID=1974565 RepID=A0A2H0V4S8_9BACT|nr:MAG: hypothetical protein COT97_03280 [Candidatus Falkowbacteria bacterium CG10_big_fil_rev_8_21_14_0_10_39_11]